MKELIRKTKLIVGQKIVSQLVSRGVREEKRIGSERIVVAGLFSTASGIGESARLCKNGLKAHNINLETIDISWIFDQQDLQLDSTEAKTLKNPSSGGTIIIHLNAPETMIALWKIGLLRHHRKWRIIGYWAWELESLPDSWSTALKYLSEIWVPSKFVKKAVSSTTTLQVKVVPHAVNIPKSDKDKQHSLGLTFLTMGDGLSSFERKNILGTIKAYKLAFPKVGSTKLLVKCRNIHLYSNWLKTAMIHTDDRNDIVFIFDNFSRSEIDDLISKADVLVSLHRSEGFGLPIAEAIARKKYVICTGWSGNMEFTNEKNACLVDFMKTSVVDPHGVYASKNDLKWAEPDIKQAAEYMRDINDRPDFYQDMFKKAKATLAITLSTKKYLIALGVSQP